MPDERILLIAVASSATLVAGIVLVLRWVGRPAWQSIGGTAAIAAALLVGGAILDVWPQWKLAEDRDRYFLLLLPLAVVAELIAALLTKHRWAVWLARSVVALSVVPILLWGSVSLPDGPALAQADFLLWWGGATAALLVVWAALLPLAQRDGKVPFALGLSLVMAGASLTILLSNSISLGVQGAPLAGAVLGAGLGGIGAKPARAAEGWLGVALVLYFGALVRAFWFIDLPLGYVVALWLAPLLAWVPDLSAFQRLANGARGGLRTGLILVPVLVVVLIAGTRFAADSRSHDRQDGPVIDDYANDGSRAE